MTSAPDFRYMFVITWMVGALALPACGLDGSLDDVALPRTADGHPDFQGIWQVRNTAHWNLQDHAGSYKTPAGLGVVVLGTLVPDRLPDAVALEEVDEEPGSEERGHDGGPPLLPVLIVISAVMGVTGPEGEFRGVAGTEIPLGKILSLFKYEALRKSTRLLAVLEDSRIIHINLPW